MIQLSRVFIVSIACLKLRCGSVIAESHIWRYLEDFVLYTSLPMSQETLSRDLQLKSGPIDFEQHVMLSCFGTFDMSGVFPFPLHTESFLILVLDFLSLRRRILRNLFFNFHCLCNRFVHLCRLNSSFRFHFSCSVR